MTATTALPAHARISAARRVTLTTRIPIPLLAVLGVQIALSFRLLFTKTAFIDEATYLYAGHQMLAHWTTGVGVENFPQFLSGSVAVYPPIGAIADDIGGLTGARLLGLAFMLGATILLYRTTQRLFGSTAGIIAAALFAVLMGTQFLSAFATYDPMALFLLTLSAYLVLGVEADDSLWSMARVVVLAALALALANACKYATALWDPILIALVALSPALAGREVTRKYAAGLAARFTVVLGVTLGAGLLIAGPSYWRGIAYTTINRSSQQIGMGQPAGSVLHAAWQWIWPVLIPAALAVAWCVIRRRDVTAMLAVVLFTAAVVAPLNQARIGTLVSLQKHAVFGAWFGCILVGRLFIALRVHRWRRNVALAIAGAGTAALLPITMNQASSAYQWPSMNPAFIAALRPLVHDGTQRYLIEGSAYITAYYVGVPNSTQWKESPSYTVVNASGQTLTGMAALTYGIEDEKFTLVILSGVGPYEPDIQEVLAKHPQYQRIATLPPDTTQPGGRDFTVWRLNGVQAS